MPGEDDVDRIAIGEELIGKVHDPKHELVDGELRSGGAGRTG